MWCGLKRLDAVQERWDNSNYVNTYITQGK